jgi:hypothetical protein
MKNTSTRMIKTTLLCGMAAAMLCLILWTAALIKETIAGYLSGAEISQSAAIAGCSLEIEASDAGAEVTQNEAWDYGKIISLDNRSHVALAYNIVVSLEGGEDWPEGLTATLLTEEGEKTDGVISGNACTFTNSEWHLEPGEHVQDAYGLKLATTYDTAPGDYRFSISSVVYQLD